MAGIIKPCSINARSLIGSTPSQPRPSSSAARTGMTAAISTTGRRPIPRNRIHATIGAVIVRVTTATDSTGSSLNIATLSLRVSPADAEILIDGEPWDRANGDSRFTIDVAAGRHQLEVRREGYGAYVRTIDLLGGRTAALNVALTPKEPVPAPAGYPVSAPVPVRVARR